MGLVVIPDTEASVYLDVATSPLDRVQSKDPTGQLGFGLIRPFRRDQKNDFANAGGVDLVKSCVGQILGMQGAAPENPLLQGELDWDPTRGSLIYLLRHKTNDLVLTQLGRVYVVNTLKAFEPRVRVTSVNISKQPGPDGPDQILLIDLTYDILAAPAPSNLVLFPGVDQSITLPKAA